MRSYFGSGVLYFGSGVLDFGKVEPDELIHSIMSWARIMLFFRRPQRNAR